MGASIKAHHMARYPNGSRSSAQTRVMCGFESHSGYAVVLEWETGWLEVPVSRKGRGGSTPLNRTPRLDSERNPDTTRRGHCPPTKGEVMAREHKADLTAIKGALQANINIKLAEAELDERNDNPVEARNTRRIAAEWQKVHDGTT